jgi:hypothetical protein
MSTIADAVAHIRARAAPVILLDTCSLLDLFRRDSTRQQPRVSANEIRTAAELLQLVTARPDVVHLVVPELVPGEFADHADRIEREIALSESSDPAPLAPVKGPSGAPDCCAGGVALATVG